MTNPWHSLKEIRPHTRADLLAWAKGRKVAIIGWKDKSLYLTKLAGYEHPDMVRGEDEQGLYVVDVWDQHWKEWEG